MKMNTRALLSALAIMLVLSIPSVSLAQHKHGGQKKAGMPGMKMDMPMMMKMMMKSPHHKLMTAYMKSMSAFATSLRDQAMKPDLDVEVARATVAELRHDLDGYCQVNGGRQKKPILHDAMAIGSSSLTRHRNATHLSPTGKP